MVRYEKMSLFDAPKGALLMHACNAQGVWGSGIAKEFRTRYPKAYEEYHDFCNQQYGMAGISHFSSIEKNNHNVISLITSVDFGHYKDAPEVIIIQTILALRDLMQNFVNCGIDVDKIYCNKFNSGLFAVPWEKTEAVLEYFSGRYGMEFVVCDPDLT